MKAAKVIKIIFYRLGAFLLLLVLSPFWVFAGIILAFGALFGICDGDRFEEPDVKTNCPDEVEPPYEGNTQKIPEQENDTEVASDSGYSS